MVGTIPAGKREGAETAFRALLDLDPAGPQRQELREHGVPEHTIESLFPRTGYPELGPYLIEHLETLSDEHLITAEKNQPGGRLQEVWGRVPMHVAQLSIQDEEADDEAIKQLEQNVWDYLSQRLARPFSSKRKRESMINTGSRIERTIWNTHWLMCHRDQLLVPDDADQLMLHVAEMLALAPEER